MRKADLLLIFLVQFSLIVVPLFSQVEKATLEDYIISRTTDQDGNEIVGIIVPGRPPDSHREPIAMPTRSSVMLPNAPAFTWVFGCSATAAAMAAGYYDNNGYPDMYTGPTNGGVMPMNNSTWGTVVINGETRALCPLSATMDGLDGRVGRGHVDDYWVSYGSSAPDPYITNGWTQHDWEDCTGDFMGTNQSAYQCIDGGTRFYFATNGSPLHNYIAPSGYIDGCHGWRNFYESRGYTVIQNYSQYIYGHNGNTIGFTFEQYKSEIDNGRPVIIQVTGHSMLGVGYDDSGNTVYLHDTWDYNLHSMTWGGTYSTLGLQHYAVTVVELDNYFNCSGIPGLWNGMVSSDWNDPANWCNDTVPGSSTGVSIHPLSVHWPEYSGALVIGTDCGDVTIPDGSEMTVTGDLVISAGSSLVFEGDGLLKVSGDWNNMGTFVAGTGAVEFTGSSGSSIYGGAPSVYTIGGYTRSTFTKGITFLTGGTAGPTGTNVSMQVPLGFSFDYVGGTYTQGYISTNGILTFGSSGASSNTNTNLFNTSTPNSTITPWWDYLKADGSAAISYKTEGDSPNRIFTVEWYNILTFYLTATVRINFQLKLYEGSNIIEFHYGNLGGGTKHHNGEGASIGIEDDVGGSGHFIEATTGSTTTGIDNLKSNDHWPTVNYRFSPPDPLPFTEQFHHVVISKTGQNIEFEIDAEISGSLSISPGANLTISEGKTVSMITVIP